MVVDTNIYNSYVPAVHDIKELDGASVYFYLGNGFNVCIAKVMPTEIIYVGETTGPAGYLNKDLIETLLLGYLEGEGPIPETGRCFLVDAAECAIIYDIDNKDLIWWDKVSVVPAFGADVFRVLMFFVDQAGDFNPLTMYASNGRASAIFMNSITKEFAQPTGKATIMGTEMICRIISQMYRIPCPEYTYQDMAVSPTRLGLDLEEVQLTSLEKFKSKVGIKLNFDDNAEFFNQSTIPLTWIHKRHRLPVLDTYKYVTRDMSVSDDDDACITSIACHKGKMFISITSHREGFSITRWCNRLGIQFQDVTVNLAVNSVI